MPRTRRSAAGRRCSISGAPAGSGRKALRPTRRCFRELTDRLTGGRATLPSRSTDRFLEHSAALAVAPPVSSLAARVPRGVPGRERRCRGRTPASTPIVGNPPWDMVRGDSGDAGVRAGRRLEARQFTDFAREAGIYRVESRAHVNRYQLFVERALQLARPGGRIGLVLPSGVVTDTGAAPLRHHLFDRADVDTVTGLDNRGGIFPIHRSLRFVLLTATAGPADAAGRVPVRRASVPRSSRTRARDAPLMITRQLVERLSGPDDLGDSGDRHANATCASSRRSRRACRGSAPPNGWNVHFGRELNATDDSDAFVPVHWQRRRAVRCSRANRSSRSVSPSRRAATSWPTARDGAASAAPRAPRLPRYRERHQSPHAHRRDRPAARGDDPHAVLPEDAAPRRRATRPRARC